MPSLGALRGRIMGRTIRVIFALAAMMPIGGCGLQVPSLGAGEEPYAPAFLINSIVNHVKCELRAAVIDVTDYDKANAAQQADRKRRLEWLDKWSADFTMKIIVDEKSTLSPGVSFNQPLENAVSKLGKTSVTTGQSFSLGLGGSLSSQATRIETVDFSFVFKSDFLDKRNEFKNRPTKCVGYEGMQIDGDLKIHEWLQAATFPYLIPGNVHDSPPKTLQHEIQFVVAGSGNVNPTWKLVHFANGAGNTPLFNASRTYTNSLIITIGPADGQRKKPSKDVTDAHFVGKMGSSFTSALKSAQ